MKVLPDALQDFFTPRTTRSQRVFSLWEGPVITTSNPGFDLDAVVRCRVEEEDALDAYDPFGQSPLSSPPSTPCISRVPSLNADPLTEPPPSTPATLHPTDASTSQTHSKSRNNRKRKRRETKAEHNSSLHQDVPPRLRSKHTHATEPLVTAFDVDDAPHASLGYIGLVEESWKREHTLDELTGPKFNFRHYGWQGCVATPIVDQQGRVIAVLAGHPDDPDWDSVHNEAAEALETLRPKCKLAQEQRKHRRGRFGALSYGISYGGGQTHPQNLHHNDANTSVLLTLVNCIAFMRLAAFGSSAFATWAPRTFAYYATHLHALLLHDASLIRNWLSSIFAAATFNFGPRTCCFRHTDSGNLPFGWCVITALGNFNPQRGGHLVLWDLKLVIDFPPSSSILIPSAILSHSNTKIGKGERRYSFTQYSAGGLFRWVDYGFRSSEEYRASLQGEELIRAKEECAARWSMGLDMFSTLDELRTST